MPLSFSKRTLIHVESYKASTISQAFTGFFFRRFLSEKSALREARFLAHLDFWMGAHITTNTLAKLLVSVSRVRPDSLMIPSVFISAARADTVV